jgi:hypothetical protein
MWMIGTIGLFGWITILTPVAKNAASATPSALVMFSGRCPCTAEKFTPPFSITAPASMMREKPPPPPGRSHASSRKWPTAVLGLQLTGDAEL